MIKFLIKKTMKVKIILIQFQIKNEENNLIEEMQN